MLAISSRIDTGNCRALNSAAVLGVGQPSARSSWSFHPRAFSWVPPPIQSLWCFARRGGVPFCRASGQRAHSINLLPVFAQAPAKTVAPKGEHMRSARYLYAGAVVVALVIGLGLWKPTHVKADRDDVPKFRVDASWPKELPAPTGYNLATWPTPTPGDKIAHRWVQGEVAGNCTDQWDNIYTFNRGWQVGASVNGVLQNNESGAIDGNDATGAKAMPSPPVVAFAPDGRTLKTEALAIPRSGSPVRTAPIPAPRPLDAARTCRMARTAAMWTTRATSGSAATGTE